MAGSDFPGLKTPPGTRSSKSLADAIDRFATYTGGMTMKANTGAMNDNTVKLFKENMMSTLAPKIDTLVNQL